tara:strand:+ start:2219 stop:3892 length:1674 start_codon:yes stop_codon:yes gene_type:complete
MAVPLRSGDQFIGALGVSSKTAQYSTEDLTRAVRLGNLIAGSLESLHLRDEQIKTQSELVKSEERLRQIVDCMRGAFWLLETSPLKGIYFSPGFKGIAGCRPEELYEDVESWYAHVREDDRERIKEANRVAACTGLYDEEYRIIGTNGSVRWVSSRGFPIRDRDGEIYRMGGIIEDITEQKETADRLAEASRITSIGELSAGMAHEINNPLASIALYSQALLSQDLADPIRHDVEIVHDSAQRAAKIVRNLLLFARKTEPERQPADMPELVTRALEIMSADLKSADIEVTNNVGNDLPRVFVDDYQIIEVIINILTNARQACSDASGPGQIILSSDSAEGLVKLRVKDNGHGISTQVESRIFEPFFTTKEVGQGTGLGLSVSYGIISQHGGDIRCESEEGAGATFVIEIPAYDEVEPRPVGKAKEIQSASRASTKHVSVVDDESSLRDIVARQLALRNFTVDQAGTGPEAQRKLQQLHYNCILLNIKMPDMDGAELYRYLEENLPELTDKIIFVTGDLVSPHTQKFLGGLPNVVLNKPFDLWEVFESVYTICGESQP